MGRGIFDGAFVVESGFVLGTVTERVVNASAPYIRIEDQYGRTVAEGYALPSSNIDIDKPAAFQIEMALIPSCFGFEELALRAFADDVEFAQGSCSVRLAGYLDDLSPTHCRGWLLSPDAPRQRFEIEVFDDGEQIGEGSTILPREDLRDLYPIAWKTAGFDFPLRTKRSNAPYPQVCSVRLARSMTQLFDGPFAVTSCSDRVAAVRQAAILLRANERLSPLELASINRAMTELIQNYRSAPAAVRVPLNVPNPAETTTRRFNIIIPIYKGVAITRACIQSVLETRDPIRDSVVLINDCSPDPEMARMLGSLAAEAGVYLLDNASNLGFVGSVNRGLAFSRIGHAVLLNSDTRVFQGAWDEMERLLLAEPDIGTITALSNNATIFTYPHLTLVAEGPIEDLSWAELAEAALEINAGNVVDVPTGHGFCMTIRRCVLDSVGYLDPRFGRGYCEENDFCMRAADRGWRNVAACAVFVEHRESVSFQGDRAALIRSNMSQLSTLYPDYIPTVMRFERDDPLRVARWPLDGFRLKRAAAVGGRYALIIQNSLGGGTKTAIQDIETAYGYDGRERITLTFRKDGMRELIVRDPRIYAVFTPEDDDALFSILEDANVDLVLVHQLLGSTHGFVQRLGRWGSTRQMKFYMHDFYAFCPRVTMLDALNRFCRAAGVDKCARCVDMAGSHEASQLDNLRPAEHRALFDIFLQQCKDVIAPSNDTARWANRIFSELVISAIPHPQLGMKRRASVRDGDPNQIVLLGAIGPHKGSRRLLELARQARLEYPALRFHVVGHTDIDKELRAEGNVTITGPYRPEELESLVYYTRARVALFLHEWPETFSYTLTEAWLLGLWPIVPSLGAPAERVTDKKDGSIVDILDISDLIATIRLVGTTDWSSGGNPNSFTCNLTPDDIMSQPADCR
jgi:GT2 family glycosyltransferase/glycosyltransferase involved in cell wall biosynthesis